MNMGSRKSECSSFPFIMFTPLCQGPEACKEPIDGKMCNSISCTCSVIPSWDDEAGNEFQLGSCRCVCVGGTLIGRDAKTLKVPVSKQTHRQEKGENLHELSKDRCSDPHLY